MPFFVRAPELHAADYAAVSATSPAAISGRPLLQLGNPWSMPADLEAVLPPVPGLGVLLPMTREDAMAIPSVARARHVLTTRIAALELREYAGDDSEPIDREHEAPWIARTDSALHPFHRMLWTVDDCYFYGFSLWKRRNFAEYPHRPAHMDRIAKPRWNFDPAGRIELDGKPVEAGEVTLIVGPHEGVLNFAGGAFRHAANLQRQADKVAETPAAHIDLHQVAGEALPKPERDELIAAWRAARLGANAGVAYSSPNIEVRELGTIDAHLLVDGRNAAAVDVARSSSLPADVIDAATEASMTYSNSRDNDRRLVDYGLSGYMSAISASLSVDGVTPRGRRVAFDLEKWLPTAGLSVASPEPASPPAPAPSEPQP